MNELLLSMAEKEIQRLLLGLDDKLALMNLRIDCVDVDTRNFANLKTVIHTVTRNVKK